MLARWRVELFKRITKIGRCGLVGGGVLLGVDYEVLKVQAQPRGLSLLLNQDVPLSYLSTTLACCCVLCHDHQGRSL